MELRGRPQRLVVLLVVCGAMARPAVAEPVRIDFYFTLTRSFGDMAPLAGFPMAPGDRIRGSLVYDASAPRQPIEPNFGQYRPSGFVTLAFGPGMVLPLDGMFVANRRAPFQTADVLGTTAATQSFPGFESVVVELEFRGDRPGVTLPADSAEFMAGFPDGFLRGQAWQIGGEAPFDTGTQEFGGTIAPVPEPGTLVLVGSAGALLIRRYRRRSRSVRASGGVVKACNLSRLAG